jgi:dienelactone hydrolase
MRHTNKVNWARKEALPQIIGLVEDEKFRQAFDLASEAKEFIPSDPLLLKQWDKITRQVSVNTSPPGAGIYLKDYSDVDDDWIYLGQSPIDSIAVPVGFFRWKIEKSGYQTIVIAALSSEQRLDFVLDRIDCIPEGMVRVHVGSRKPLLGATRQLEIVEVEDFYIDRFEVTNEQYQTFVDSGGYGRKDFWKHKFAGDGEVLSWEDAMALFRDATGRPGPVTWELGRYPEGQGDCPVTGISWYEAAAYAEFAGKQLPTVYHWAYAASVRASAYIIPHSNFGHKGLAAIGTHDGLSRHGTYDMAGNAREWCHNATEDNRYILGGCWSDPAYTFHFIDRKSVFDRSPANGFRCAKYLNDSAAQRETLQNIHPAPVRDYCQEAPISDEIFEAYSTIYYYSKSPLNATVNLVDSQPEFSTIEKISFDAAYGNERMFGYLYHPVNATPPYQIIILFPGAYALEMRSSGNGHDINSWDAVDFIIKSGRAVFYPIYKSTHERGDGFDIYSADEADYREHAIMWWKDLARSIDYLETRPDIDMDKLCYVGSSWGAWIAPVFLALDNRLRVAVLRLGGFPPWEMPPAFDPLNFAPRAKIPVLMLNGRYDYIFPYETSQIPMFERFGTHPEYKRHVLFETAHTFYGHRNEMIREVLDWLDRYLGPVK